MSRFLLLAILFVPVAASAQRRLAQDTLSADVPSAVTCGFCAGERFGVIFRELPAPFRGIVAADFPVVPEAIEIAMASADAASSCAPSMTGATIMAAIELYVGTSLQEGSVVTQPIDGPWAGETAVWGAEAPLMLSTADGMGRYSLNFNSLVVRDGSDMPIRIESGSYLRVAVTIPAGVPGSSPMCEPMYESPAGFPFRDEGRVAPNRSFIYAAGVGWLWNEAAGVGGDWSIRMTVVTEGTGMTDAGTTPVDGGPTPSDGGAMDGGADGGPGVMPAGGCGCRVGGRAKASSLPLLALLALVRSRRRR